MDYRETLEDALIREVAEETGLQAEIIRPLCVNDTIDPRGSRHVVNVTFLARVTGGSLTETPQDPRVEAVDLVEPSELASLDLRPPLAPFLLEAFEEGIEEVQACYLGSLFVDGPVKH